MGKVRVLLMGEVRVLLTAEVPGTACQQRLWTLGVRYQPAGRTLPATYGLRERLISRKARCVGAGPTLGAHRQPRLVCVDVKIHVPSDAFSMWGPDWQGTWSRLHIY